MADDRVTILELRERVARFVHEREWERFHHAKDLAMALSIEASELLEAYLWKERADADTLEGPLRAAVADELADVFIYGLSFANAMGLDLSDAILAKIAKNEAKYPVEAFRGRAPQGHTGPP